MRARTLVALLAFSCLALPVRAQADSHIISERTDVPLPYVEATSGDIPINDDFFVATGTISDVVIAVGSYLNHSPDDQIYMRLVDMTRSVALDCQTPIKTFAQWGITTIAGDISGAPTDFGPFTGPDCDIPDRALGGDEIWAWLYHADDFDAANSIGWLADNKEHFNFTVYGKSSLATTTPTEVATAASSVLFLPGTEASRLYTRFLGTEVRVWEPNILANTSLLALNSDGTSANDIYTKDIVDGLYSTPVTPGVVGIYGSLEKYLDGLVAADTIKEWRAYPYDWRYDPFDIVNNGTRTEMPDGSLQTIYLADVLREMASSSPTGKVTIVAHSSGGLLAKALAVTLGPDAANYIDRIILIGTPQLGTPSDIGAMLHGDGQTYLGGLIMDGGAIREEAANMPGIYALLPSSGYFSTVTNPVAAFEPGTLSSKYSDAYGASISSRSSLEGFARDASSIDGQIGAVSDTNVPLVLRNDLLAKAEATHDQIDSWVPASGISLTSIAGWGQRTVAGLDYSTGNSIFSCERDGPLSPAKCGFGAYLSHAGITTEDGDGVVVSPSAVGNVGDEWYFDTQDFTDQNLGNISHINLTSALPILNAIRDILTKQSISEKDFLSTKPAATINPLITIGSRSASKLVVVDDKGNETGILPVPDVPQIFYEKQNVPGSSIDSSSPEQIIYIPQTGNFNVLASGYSGSASIIIGGRDVNGIATTTAIYSSIPTTASTSITFSINNGIPTIPSVDINGDGSETIMATNVPPALSDGEILSQLQTQLQSLNLRIGIKNRLLRALQEVQAQKDVLVDAQSTLSNLENLIEVQTGIKLTLEQGASMLQLLNSLKQ